MKEADTHTHDPSHADKRSITTVVFDNAEALRTYLNGLQANTAETSYKVSLNVDDISDMSYALGHSFNQYVDLDLSGSNITSIGNYAFSNCEILTNVIIPTGVTGIGDNAFQNCRNLTGVTIPNTVATIGHSAFFNCSSLAGIGIPASVTGIGNDVFAYSYNLTAIEVDPANSAYCSAGGILYTKDKSSLIACPTGKTGTVTIPDSVTTIERYAFHSSGITGLIIGNSVVSIGYEAFGACTGLTNVAIPDSVTAIGEMAFVQCNNLGSITLGNNVTGIGRGAFAATAITSVTIPASVVSIDSEAFINCDNLASVTFEGTIPASGFPETDDSDPFPMNRSAFPGDLQNKYLDTVNGGPGVYTTANPGENSLWTKQYS